MGARYRLRPLWHRISHRGQTERSPRITHGARRGSPRYRAEKTEDRGLKEDGRILPQGRRGRTEGRIRGPKASGLTVFGSMAWSLRSASRRRQAESGERQLWLARVFGLFILFPFALFATFARELFAPRLSPFSLSARNLGLLSVTSVGKSESVCRHPSVPLPSAAVTATLQPLIGLRTRFTVLDKDRW